MIQLFHPDQYQARCEHLFELYKHKIQMKLPDAQIEHIGASAINHAISKGDLDIYVAVSPNNFEFALGQVKQLGFHEKLHTHRAHDLCMLDCDLNDDVAIQLVVRDSEWQCFLKFRDCLNNSKELIEEYNQIKLKYSQADMEQYRKQKALFIQYVLNLTY